MTAELPPQAEPANYETARSGAGNGVAVVALVAFVFGVILNGYIAFSILDDGESSASSPDESPIIVPADPTTEPTATLTPQPDRSDCEEIRGTDYRSATERTFFLENCINQPEPSPTIDPTQLPPLDGGTSTEATEDDATPTPEP